MCTTTDNLCKVNLIESPLYNESDRYFKTVFQSGIRIMVETFTNASRGFSGENIVKHSRELVADMAPQCLRSLKNCGSTRTCVTHTQKRNCIYKNYVYFPQALKTSIGNVHMDFSLLCRLHKLYHEKIISYLLS